MTANQVTLPTRPEERSTWFVEAVRAVSDGDGASFLASNESVQLIEELAESAERFVASRIKNKNICEGTIDSLSMVRLLKSTGTVPGRTAEDFFFGQVVKDSSGRRGRVIGESARANTITVRWAGSKVAEPVSPSSVVSIPLPVDVYAESTVYQFDERGCAVRAGERISPSSDRDRAILSGRQAHIVDASGNGAVLYAFPVMEGAVSPISIRLERSVSASTINESKDIEDASLHRMIEDIQWFREDVVQPKTVEAERARDVKVEAVFSGSQAIFESVMSCPGNAKDAAWLADALASDEALVEATKDASRSGGKVDPTVCREAIERCERSFYEENRRVPSVSQVMQRVMNCSINERVSNLDASSLKPLVFGKPEPFYMKRNNEIRQSIGQRADSGVTTALVAKASQGIVAAANVKSNPSSPSPNLRLANALADIFQILSSKESEPWNPIRTSNKPIEYNKANDKADDKADRKVNESLNDLILEAKKNKDLNLKPTDVLRMIEDETIDGVFLLEDEVLNLWFLPGDYGRSSRHYSGADLTRLVKTQDGFVSLGSDGWYGGMSKDQIEASKKIRKWLGRSAPGYPNEYVDAQDIIQSRKNGKDERVDEQAQHSVAQYRRQMGQEDPYQIRRQRDVHGAKNQQVNLQQIELPNLKFQTFSDGSIAVYPRQPIKGHDVPKLIAKLRTGKEVPSSAPIVYMSAEQAKAYSQNSIAVRRILQQTVDSEAPKWNAARARVEKLLSGQGDEDTGVEPKDQDVANEAIAYFEINGADESFHGVLSESDGLRPGVRHRIIMKRPISVAQQARDKPANVQNLDALHSLLTSVRQAASQVSGQPGSNAMHKRLAKSLASLIAFVTTHSDQPWSVISVS